MSAAAGAVSPAPQGRYVAAKRHGAVVYTAGMTPRREGALLLTGPVRTGEPIDSYRTAVTQAAANALAAARSLAGPGEAVTAVLSLTVYIAAEAGFGAHSRLADFASEFLHAELGPDGIGARTAVGVATLPGNAPVEIQLIAALGPAAPVR